MLWTFVLLLMLMWALGMITSTMAGGFVHLLLLVALVVVVVRVIQGRRVLD